MSRPWKVAETGSSRNVERAMSAAARTPPALLGRGHQQPVVGPDEHAAVSQPERDGPALGPDVGVDDGQVDAHRQKGSASASTIAPAWASWRRIP